MKVFLGGTCNETTWRDKLIEKLKIDYFNPIVDDWDEKAQEEEIKQRKICDYLLYTITPRMKGVYSICEVTQDSNINPNKTILCILKNDIDNMGNIIEFNDSQWKSLKQVAKMIENNGAKVFYNLDDVAKYLNK